MSNTTRNTKFIRSKAGHRNPKFFNQLKACSRSIDELTENSFLPRPRDRAKANYGSPLVVTNYDDVMISALFEIDLKKS